jgi:NAD(P)-dependent dehydrogenase (short-subunit alcohol dehydrogenase family)
MSGKWTLADIPSQVGKRFFITGGNSGVGYYAAVELARRGGVVVLACRDRAKGELALRQLGVDAAGPESAADRAELVVLNLASLESVRRVAEDAVALGLPIDGLINNAGVMTPPNRLETKDGFELQFGTNVLGHFALTCRMMPVIRERVVTVASIAHKRGRINFDDLQSTKSYKPMRGYEQSKLGNVMFMLELERRLRAAGSSVLSIGVHPGVALTNLFKVGDGTGLAGVAQGFVRMLIGTLMGSGRDGAVPTVYAATAADAQGGGYYGPQGFMEMRGGDVGPAFVAAAARDVAAERRLWQVCAQLTGVDLA